MKELVDDEEHCPVCPVCVDKDGEKAKAVDSIAVSLREGGEKKHEDDLGNAEQNLDDGNI